MKSIDILSKASFQSLMRRYRRRYSMAISRVESDGMCGDLEEGDPLRAPMLCAARRDALSEAERWGEPYVYFLCSGVVSWMVPLCDGTAVCGGLTGGVVLTDEEQGSGEDAAWSLVSVGVARSAAVRDTAHPHNMSTYFGGQR